MSSWRDINKDSWTFTRKKIAGYGGGIGELKTSYAVNLENGLLLNGKISADLRIVEPYLTGAGLICRADGLWTFLAFYTAPNSKENRYTVARLGLFKQGLFAPIATLNEEIYLDEDYNQFSLEWFSGKIRGEIKTSTNTYEVIRTCPHIPFSGYAGLVKFYGAGVLAKNIQIEKTDIPFEEKRKQKMKQFNFDVFVCHSSNDKPIIADEIIQLFKKEGITYWLDSEQIKFGDSITQKIEEGLQKSRCVMPCLSENLSQSNWSRAEYGAILNAEFSGNSERIIVPLKLDNCDNNHIPMLLKDKKRVTYFNKTEFLEFLKFIKS